jgi:Cof subfamily protein (haloacid dehalogenase superfamily)
MPYKLLALDMDGTLLTSHKEVSPRTRAALRDLAERGVPIAFCTGRCFKELMDWPRELPFIRYGVLASGAVEYDFAHKTTLDISALGTETILKAMEIASIEKPMTHVLGIGDSVARPDDVRVMERYGMGVYKPMYEKICTFADDLEEWVRTHEGEVVKLNFYHVDSRSRDRTRERIARAGLPITLANAEVGSVECSASGVSKAQGLRMLATHLGIGLDDVVAVGDSDNDLTALSAVGMPVAMGNASESIRRLAKLVVASNDEDGIAEAVARLF